MENILVVHREIESEEDVRTMDSLREILEKTGERYDVTSLDILEQELFMERGLVIAMGGDGTLLRTAHKILDDTPILGVNMDLSRSIGFLTQMERKNLDEKFSMLTSGNYKIQRATRIDVYLNGERIPEAALNDVYVGNRISYRPSYYTVKFKIITDDQVGNGLVISTGTGSTAWYKSLGGKPFDSEDRRLKFKVISPYSGRERKCAGVEEGEIEAGGYLEVYSSFPEKYRAGCVAIDSQKDYPFLMDGNERDVIKIGISDYPLSMIRV